MIARVRGWCNVRGDIELDASSEGADSVIIEAMSHPNSSHTSAGSGAGCRIGFFM